MTRTASFCASSAATESEDGMLDRKDEEFLQRVIGDCEKEAENLNPFEQALRSSALNVARISLKQSDFSDDDIEVVTNAVYSVSRIFADQPDTGYGKAMLFDFTRTMNLFLLVGGGKEARKSFQKWRGIFDKYWLGEGVGKSEVFKCLLDEGMIFEKCLKENPISSDVMISDIHREMVTKEEFRQTTDEIKEMIVNNGGKKAGKVMPKKRHCYEVPVQFAADAMFMSKRELERILAKEINAPEGFPGLDSRSRFEFWVREYRVSRSLQLEMKKDMEKRKWGSGKPRPEKPDRA